MRVCVCVCVSNRFFLHQLVTKTFSSEMEALQEMRNREMNKTAKIRPDLVA